MSRLYVLPGALSLALVFGFGCFTGGGDPNAGNDAGGSALPCDVAQALASCQGCHGSPPAVGVPFSLVAYSDLTQTSPTYSDQTVAQRAVARMGDPNIPMPPHPLDPSPQSDIDTIQAWINAGYPGGSCTPPTGATNPYDTPENACTNGKSTVTYGSNLMRPGDACMRCHGSNFSIAGTVYPSAHEQTLCNGSNAAAATIVITDANNQTVTLHPNSAGNFYSYTNIAMPYTVKLTYNGNERDMTGLVTAPTNGDCNSCHTMDGTNGAPGRIMLP